MFTTAISTVMITSAGTSPDLLLSLRFQGVKVRRRARTKVGEGLESGTFGATNIGGALLYGL